jgi:hypothetical protein
MTGLRERLALSLLRTATDLAHERQAMFDRIAERPSSAGRDRALGDLAVGAWTESALLWLGWRLLPGAALAGHVSAR